MSDKTEHIDSSEHQGRNRRKARKNIDFKLYDINWWIGNNKIYRLLNKWRERAVSRSRSSRLHWIKMLSGPSHRHDTYLSSGKNKFKLWQSRQQSQCNKLSQLLLYPFFFHLSFDHLKCGTQFRLQKWPTRSKRRAKSATASKPTNSN